MSEQPKYGIGSKAWCAGFLRGMVPDYPDSRG